MCPGIAAELNERNVPCPSQADPDRNRHRRRAEWGLTTVRAILGNAKYTGRQVWNRQPARHTPAHLPGPFKVQQWAGAQEWVVSRAAVHPALVSEADFVAVQELAAQSARSAQSRPYHLAGLLRCGACQRMLDSCWSHGKAAYRCRHGHTSASAKRGDRPKNLYVREDVIVTIIHGHDDSEMTAADVAAHLRLQGKVASCAESACTIEAA